MSANLALRDDVAGIFAGSILEASAGLLIDRCIHLFSMSHTRHAAGCSSICYEYDRME